MGFILIEYANHVITSLAITQNSDFRCSSLTKCKDKPQLCAHWLCIMPDYEKLTVIKLRDELVARGLPKTGLKAALIQRLVEADAESEEVVLAATESSKENQRDEYVIWGAPGVPQALRVSKESDHAVHDAQQSGEQNKGALKAVEAKDEFAPPCEPGESVRVQYQIGEVQEDKQAEEQAPDNFSPKAMQSEKLSEDTNGDAKEPELQLSTPAKTHTGEVQAAKASAEIPTHMSLTSDEILEDSRKRKRRSQSPPPSSMEKSQKRFKASNGRPSVELPEDCVAERSNEQEKLSEESSRPDLTDTQGSDTQVKGHTRSNGEHKPAKSNPPGFVEQPHDEGISYPQSDSSSVLQSFLPQKEGHATPTRVKSVESPMKPPPSDTRFKNLFTAPATLEPASQQSHYLDAEEKVVSPALHPATSALYIRELMRPLKIESLKDHLIALATPPDTTVNPDIMMDFFLDSIRSHCLVGFENISAASRVRSGLHDRIWPNERDRRQLWVDFVPEEKLKKWIDVERTASNVRGLPSKRWEIVYEEEENDIKAYLQEVGSNSGGRRAVPPARLDAGRGIQIHEPSISGSDPRNSQPKLENGNGFRALDDLFTSTAAKPKLYYLSVPKVEADRRLAKLAAGRGRGRDDEMRRFSFEGGSIVDNGPEFGRGYGKGGGYSGSYRGRGRVYRADASRGDSWRQRRRGY